MIALHGSSPFYTILTTMDSKPRKRIVKIEDTVILYLADLLDQWRGIVKTSIHQAKKTGQSGLSGQSNTAGARPGT